MHVALKKPFASRLNKSEVEGNRGAENVVTAPIVTGFSAFAVHRVLTVKAVRKWTR